MWYVVSLSATFFVLGGHYGFVLEPVTHREEGTVLFTSCSAAVPWQACLRERLAVA